MGTRVLLDNPSIAATDAARHHYNCGAIPVDGDRISRAGTRAEMAAETSEGTQRVDLRGRRILPGLTNIHVHPLRQLGRHLAEDVNLSPWLHDQIWPRESSLIEEDSYVNSLRCRIEQIRDGATCFAEAGGQFVEGMGRAISQLGLRGALASPAMNVGEGPPTWNENTSRALQV